MAASIAIVTDSTACLPGDLAARYQITAVPLGVVISGARFDDDAAGLPGRVEAEIRSGAAVTTASPGPERFTAAYAAAAAAGIVSVHLSGSVSGTVDSARLAAAAASVPVRVVDSRSLGLGLGFAVLAAAQAARGGASIDDVAAAAAGRAAGLRSFFAVAAADRLLAGGRLGAPGAGRLAARQPALTARPLLHITGGRIELLDKTRTRSAAIRRLAELAAEAAAGEPADLAVQFLGDAGPAAALAGQLAEVVPGYRGVCLVRGDAVIAAHTGTGMLGVVVAPAA
jgi:DegV family protein with EDD domain